MAEYSNLPISETKKERSSSDRTLKFFDAYNTAPLEFKASDADAFLGFFRKRGMDEDAARTTSFIVLRQAKLDEVNPLTFLDQIKAFTDMQLSDLIGEILNNNRIPTSTLGTAKPSQETNPAKRNIFA